MTLPVNARGSPAHQRHESTITRDEMLSLQSPLLQGLNLPAALNTHAAVATILSHQAGRLTRAQIREAAAQKNAEDQARNAKLQQEWRLRAGSNMHLFDYSLDPDKDLSFAGDSIEFKKVIFNAQLTEYEQHERLLEINPSKHRLGHAVMTESERDELEIKREQQINAARKAERDRAASRTETVLTCDPVAYIVKPAPTAGEVNPYDFVVEEEKVVKANDSGAASCAAPAQPASNLLPAHTSALNVDALIASFQSQEKDLRTRVRLMDVEYNTLLLQQSETEAEEAQRQKSRKVQKSSAAVKSQ